MDPIPDSLNVGLYLPILIYRAYSVPILPKLQGSEKTIHLKGESNIYKLYGQFEGFPDNTIVHCLGFVTEWPLPKHHWTLQKRGEFGICFLQGSYEISSLH